ncbi:MAG: hypothetical protein ACI4SB_03885, partial [Acutalibacteraceae bacterium]
MKKTIIILSVLLSLSLILSACGRRTDEPSSVASPYESTTGYEIISSSETTQQVAAYTETSAAVSTVQAETSEPTQSASQFTASYETTVTESTAVPDSTQPSQSAEKTPTTPSGEYEVRQMNAEREGLSIYGNIYIPKTQSKNLPAVILSHSANMTSDSMKSYCERVASMGFVAYSF